MEHSNWGSFFILALMPVAMILILAMGMYGNYLLRKEGESNSQENNDRTP